MVKTIALCCRPSTESTFQLEIPQYIIDKAIEPQNDGPLSSVEEKSLLCLLSYIIDNSPGVDWSIRADPLISEVDDDFETDYNRDITKPFIKCSLALPPMPPI